MAPSWFFGTKGLAETAIGAPPGAIANAIYNACGVRIREHPITREKIMAGGRGGGGGRPGKKRRGDETRPGGRGGKPNPPGAGPQKKAPPPKKNQKEGKHKKNTPFPPTN